jgi:hypothetical protein
LFRWIRSFGEFQTKYHQAHLRIPWKIFRRFPHDRFVAGQVPYRERTDGISVSVGGFYVCGTDE